MIMLLINETIKRFGYNPTELSKGSDKFVIVKCDYCDATKEIKNNARSSSLKNHPKDACKKCGGKKRKEILFEKYGVETTQAIPEVRAKTKATNLKKFGSESYFASQDGKKKIKQTMIAKYGAEHNMQNEEIRSKRDATIKQKYGTDNVFKLREFQEKSIQKRIENGSIKTFNGKTIKDLAKEQNYAYSSMAERINKLGVDIATFAQKQESSLELKMASILDSIGVKYEKQFKVEKKVADFKILGTNILVEADGLYWHSDAGDKHSDYHFNKRLLYERLGYRAFFFREDEIRDKFPIVKSIITNAVGLSNKLYARKLYVKEIGFKHVKTFVQQNHLMGLTNNASHNFVLCDQNDNIYSALQIKKIRYGEYDISRFCSRLDHSVIGGFSKLLRSFIRTYSPKSIQTFIDARYGTGSYLPELGFKLFSCTKSFKWTDGFDSYHRLTYRGSSGYQHGLYKIWDCGQTKYILNIV